MTSSSNQKTPSLSKSSFHFSVNINKQCWELNLLKHTEMLKIERILSKYEGSFLLKIFSNISESIFSMVSDLYFCFWSWLPFLKTGATCWKLVLMRMDIRMTQLKMPRSTLQKKIGYSYSCVSNLCRFFLFKFFNLAQISFIWC